MSEPIPKKPITKYTLIQMSLILNYFVISFLFMLFAIVIIWIPEIDLKLIGETGTVTIGLGLIFDAFFYLSLRLQLVFWSIVFFTLLMKKYIENKKAKNESNNGMLVLILYGMSITLSIYLILWL